MSALKPVAWMHDGFISTDYAAVQRDEERNWRSGFDSKPIIALYSEDGVVALQIENDLLRAELESERMPEEQIMTNVEEVSRGSR